MYGHSGEIRSMTAFTLGDSSLVLTGSNDKSARLFSLVTGDQLSVLNGHTREVSSVAAVALDSSSSTGSKARQGRGGNSHDSNGNANNRQRALAVTGCFDKLARVFEVTDPRNPLPICVLDYHSQRINAVRFFLFA